MTPGFCWKLEDFDPTVTTGVSFKFSTSAQYLLICWRLGSDQAYFIDACLNANRKIFSLFCK